jgi:hypothetical protein
VALHQENIIGFSAENDYVVNLSQSKARCQLREKDLASHGFGATEIDMTTLKR